MIIKIYSSPTINASITDRAAGKTAQKNSLSRSISFTENSSNDIKTKAKEISLKYDLLVDDILCDTPGILKNQRERLRTIGLAVTALEQRAKTDSPNSEKNQR
ncbi:MULTISPECIES: hypothetical protein [Symbiopectobacterium]|uniref:hypothetical protein n=1 Tax=Symbiopectobacterium TaxID=801 RepID=UPI001A25E39D|nr:MULTISPECIES: hypothetical protein [Symbiopectobacterium]MBG6248880.1 hypothetical protein [Candidatus Symbiopectobacterium sp. PLON1]MBT9430331.1 hypothetical protein [Candidatus Symbiopectobacterium endolongispinus]